MILNHAADIQRGSIPTDYVYHGSVLVWQRETPEPVSEWDKFEAEHSNAITVVRLDSNNNETDDIRYFASQLAGTLREAISYLSDRYLENPNDLFNLYYGDNAIVPDEYEWDTAFSYFFSSSSNRNNIRMFRFPRKWADVNLFLLSLFNRYDETDELTRLRIVVLPGKMSDDSSSVGIPSTFLYCSGIERVVFRSKLCGSIGSWAFQNCSNLKEIEFPTFRSKNPFGIGAFRGCSNITITLNNNEGSFSGAPWGATNATVIWKGEPK